MDARPATGSLHMPWSRPLVQWRSAPVGASSAAVDPYPEPKVGPRHGLEPQEPVSTEITPYRVHVEEAVLDDLKRRLAATRFPDQIPGTGWEYGAELGDLRELVAYWRNGYDRRAAEAELRAFFRTVR